MSQKIYYAHSKEGAPKDEWQTIRQHSTNVAELCAEFSAGWCNREYAYNLGLLHDVGKYQLDFQNRICGDTHVHVEHSICGAKESEAFGIPLASYCIAGHHTGLPDVGARVDTKDDSTLRGRLQRPTQDYGAYKDELALKPLGKQMPWLFAANPVLMKKQLAFWIRMMFSSLVDADFLDTERFCQGNVERGMHADLDECLNKIKQKLDSFIADTPVKKARRALLEQIDSKKDENADLYILNMPTGSGKTLASMYFALLQAKRAGLKRVIYVIPYTSIIEQNAKVFKEIFGEDAVLEHHCNFDVDAAEDETSAQKVARSAENWDASIIVTTNVRFFESVYGNKTSKLRRLHNIAESMIVFDEVHMLPEMFYQPCLEAVRMFVKDYKCKALFMTATMPDFHKWLDEFGCTGIKTCDLIQDTSLFSVFERSKISDLGKISEEKLIETAQECAPSLIVVNTRKAARDVYTKAGGKKYHLSTCMTKEHRARVLEEVKKSLQANEKFVLISTSLIEAGVDLDFKSVFRERAGVDNILQTAGRCNREGKKDISECTSYVFDFEEDELKNKGGDMEIKTYFCAAVFEKYASALTPQAIAEYFDKLFSYCKPRMSSRDFATAITSTGYNFQKYAEIFKLIDDGTSVVVRFAGDEQQEKIINSGKTGKWIRRKLQPYAVSLRNYEYEKLLSQGAITQEDGIPFISGEVYYDPDTGIVLDGRDLLI